MTITMYGADWCGDCRRAKAYFAENDIDVEYVNAEEVVEATDIILERNAGVQRIPVIVFDDDSHLTEPTNDEIATKLADLAEGHSYVVTKNTDVDRFELHGNGDLLSHATYSEHGGTTSILHVTTLPQHRGQGNAGRLMNGVLRHIRMTRGSVAPICPFAVDHIRDNSRWQPLLAAVA